ncbi:hypothetical protein ACIBSV_45540 [Embleya sp. NPDC050154]|uniref:hypothetical protein n=1 Tax=Embleya sp. NPDC050154 TaxID=3363988 RepID=UPI00379BB1CC
MSHPRRASAAPQLASTEGDPFPEPPGSGIVIAVYWVGPDGTRVVVPPQLHKRSSRDPWPSTNPPCTCSPDCPMR